LISWENFKHNGKVVEIQDKRQMLSLHTILKNLKYIESELTR